MVGEASGANSVLEPRESSWNVEVKEFYEKDFVSDENTKGDSDEEEYEFESDWYRESHMEKKSQSEA